MVAPSIVCFDADMSRIFPLANQTGNTARASTLWVYSTLDRKIMDFLHALNQYVITSHSTTKTVISFGKSGLLQAIRRADLSFEDFAITYSMRHTSNRERFLAR